MRRLSAALVPAVLLALASLGCNMLSSSRSTPPADQTAPAVVDEEPEARNGIATRDAWIQDLDLDGDGKAEKIIVDVGEVKIGSAVAKIPEGLEEPVTVEVIDIDKKDKSREIAIVDPGIEDDATYHVYVYRNGKITVSEVFVGGEPVIDGSGVLRTTNGNCGLTTVVEWGLTGAQVTKKSEKTTGKQDDSQCAACPFVYVRGASGSRFAGEILRNLRGPALLTTQTLALDRGDVVDGRVRVRLAERKPETTYLDSIHLSVGGVRVLPESCAGGDAWCSTNGTFEVIPFGEHRDFTFVLPANALASGAAVELVAAGYYVPTAP